jgi:hypothetical protein
MSKSRWGMKHTEIGLQSLKCVKVLFENDIYDLACFLLKAYDAKDQGTLSRSRPTVHGLATKYTMMIDISRDAIIEIFNRHGLPLEATVESEEDLCVAPRAKGKISRRLVQARTPAK